MRSYRVGFRSVAVLGLLLSGGPAYAGQAECLTDRFRQWVISASVEGMARDPRRLDPVMEPLAALTAEAGPLPARLFRGFSIPSYGPKELVRYLFGDWRFGLGSRDFTGALIAGIEQRLPFGTALDQAAQKMVASIVAEVGDKGLQKWAENQSRGTWLMIKEEQKYGSGLASDPFSPFTRNPDFTGVKVGISGMLGRFIHGAFSYSRSASNAASRDRVDGGPHEPRIVVEIRPTRTTGAFAAGGEFYVFSHVQPRQIRRFYVGFDQPGKKHDLLNKHEHWYPFDVRTRDARGVPANIVVSTMKFKWRRKDGIAFEHWAIADRVWSSTDRTSPEALKRNHPDIVPALLAIRSYLPNR